MGVKQYTHRKKFLHKFYVVSVEQWKYLTWDYKKSNILIVYSDMIWIFKCAVLQFLFYFVDIRSIW